MESKKTAPAANGRLRTIELSYRPVFDIHLNMAIDYEVSMRINDKVMGVMLQEQFVPVAEKSNRICRLGLWAIEEACDAINRCEAREADINTIILWISVRHICKKNFVQQVTKILEKHAVNPDKFCFNITESILEENKAQIIENFKELRELGFKISIDDLGVEYSSLSNLSLYAVDYIGFNECIIQGIEEDEKVQNKVQGLIDFCQKIETQTRIDGVDSEKKALMLKAMGADQLKGPFYGIEMSEKSIS